MPRGALRIALAARAAGPWLRWNEPHAARASAIEIVKLSIGYRRWNDDDHSGRNVHLTRCIQLPTIVGAEAARLHQHGPRQSQRPVQMQIRLNRGIRRRKGAIQYEGIVFFRPEDVEMRVGRAGRSLESGRPGIGIRLPARRHHRPDPQKPYSAVGLSTRIWLRVASSGTQSVRRSRRSVVFGIGLLMKTCGQSLAHTILSGRASTSWAT